METMENAIRLVCPHCEAINRVLPARAHDNPVCGRCKQALWPAVPLELTDANFDRHVGQSGVPVLVDFWAPWCAPCRAMAPVIGEAARVLAPAVRVAKLNTEAETTIAARFAIRSIPMLAVFRDGRILQQRAGAMSLAALLEWVRAVVPGTEWRRE